MARQPNIYGGGAQTNANGLKFERQTDLLTMIDRIGPEYTIERHIIKKNGIEIARHFKGHSLYRDLLIPRGINYKEILSKKLLPDEALLVNNTLYLIEKKYQNVSGSVDEKLQTCDFKKKQYTRLLKPLDISVEYYYLLNDWFDQPQYKDVFDYIQSVGCKYFIGELPLSEIGLD
ncbi:hypothetical protein [Psychrobacter sp. FDAARGOS_221]|uniref:hypothetical protein n=1 Tax=Psychrobacter sp. FDAARGOS_221 TaxID=1975705 RepID=UPI000BB57643|nr:hypothetical protein [Psychrobacter sp. FDAARGOS_221]PNK60618.1 hypothetical protein A6J60_006860 [Psychrobacter sp. FDAARGOS_221]